MNWNSKLMRHNNTERIGVIETERAVTKLLKWIFREQPIIDVGIDGTIEKCDDGNPSGKFLAVQIKSGDESFHVNDRGFTLYVSNIHYYYWTNLNIPIILVGYLPSKDACYWQLIDKKTLKKTKKQWKITIPTTNVLDSKAIASLERILVQIDTKDIYSELYKLDGVSEHYELFSESVECASNIHELMTKLTAYLKKSADKNIELAANGYGPASPQFKGALKQVSRYIVSSSKRLLSEVSLFSVSYSEEIFVLSNLIHSTLEKRGKIPPSLIAQINLMPVTIEKAISDINVLQSYVYNNKVKYSVLRAAMKELGESLDSLISEYREAKTICTNLSAAVQRIS